MSKGRVFLAGDAAHIMPVIGSQGMNSGARDVNNLAWKLALVLRAGADPSILATYDTERRPQVANTIRVVTAALHLQKARSIPATVARDIAALFLNLFPPIASYVRDMRYIPKPFLRDGLIASHTRAGDNSFVGRLLPLPGVDNGHGRTGQRLDDLLGDGFAILGIEPGLPQPSLHDPLWYALGARQVTVSRPSGEANRTHGVETAVVTDNRFDEVFAAHRGHWLVIRPDRIVAAAANAASFQEVTPFFDALFGLSRSLPQAAE
jgi:3-(3-hydroxy-phenyl)propionate hydroxylase